MCVQRRKGHRFFRPRFERLENRLLLAFGPTINPDGSMEITLDDAWDQFGFQPAILQAYDSTPENGFDDALGAFSVFDTGASVVTFGANDQLVLSLSGTGGSGIPVQVPCGAVAEGVGGLSLVGHISEPGTVLADGLHVSTLSFDEDGFPVFEVGFQDPEGGNVLDPLTGESGLTGDLLLSDVDDAYNGSFLAFTDGLLRGQVRQISDYVGSTRRFEFGAAFSEEPTAGDGFVLVEAVVPYVAESASGSVSDTVPEMQRFAGSTEFLGRDAYYEGQYLQFTSGILGGQIQRIAEYTGATRTFLLASPFSSAPASGDAFRVLHINTTPAAIVPGVQAFLGTYVGETADSCPAPASEALPTITGTPMLKPTPERPQGLAANIRPSGALMDFSDFAGFEGLVIPIPDVHFQNPGLGIPEDPICLVAEGGTVRSICTDPIQIPIDFVGAEVDESGALSEDFNPVQRHVTLRHDSVELTDQVFLFDTGAQLSVISELQAISFGLDLSAPEDTISVQGAGGVINDLPGYRIDSLTVPLENGKTLTFKNVWVFVIDAAPGLLDGIMGMNLFNNAASLLYDPHHPDGPTLEMTFFTEPLFASLFSAIEEIEPNDTQDGAIAVNRGQYGFGSLDSGDVDFWGTPGGSQGDLVFAYVDTQTSSSGQDAALEIQVNDGTVIGSDQNDGPGGGAVVAGVELGSGQTGNVYYRVSGANGESISRYELYTAVVDPSEVDSEPESGSGANDTLGTATLMAQIVMAGTLAAGDVDNYGFIATEGSRIVVMMDNDPDRDAALTSTSLILFAPDGTQIFPPTIGDGDGDANAAGAVISVPAGGTYVLQVSEGLSGSDNDYRFAVLVLDGGTELLSAQLVHSAERQQAEADTTLAEAEQALAEAEQAIDDCYTDPDPFCLADAVAAYQQAVLAATLASLEAVTVATQAQYVQALSGTISPGGLPAFEVDKGGQLQVSIADTEISENGGRTTATITRPDTSGELIVSLANSNPSEASIPESITIPNGQTTSAPFAVVAVDDARLDGAQLVTITAVAAGYADGVAALEVTDSEATGPAWQNAVDPFDLDGRDGATALDVLLLVLYLNEHPGDPSLPPATNSPPPYYDVDGNGFCTAEDLLGLVIYINSELGGGEAAPKLTAGLGGSPVAIASGTKVNDQRDPPALGIAAAPNGVTPANLRSEVQPFGNIELLGVTVRTAETAILSASDRVSVQQIPQILAAKRSRPDELAIALSEWGPDNSERPEWLTPAWCRQGHTAARRPFWDAVAQSDLLDALLADAVADAV